MGRGRGRGEGNKGSKNKNKGSAGQNRAASDAYLEKNSNRSEVDVLESGLQIEVIESGSGAEPWLGCTVTTHQRTWLVNGHVIQDTFQQDQPEKYAIDEAVEGFREGLLLMREGGRCKLTLPPELAWGKKGTSGAIGPNQVLIFDVRLLRVQS